MDSFRRNTLILVLLVVADQLLKWLIENFRPAIDLGLVTIHSVHNTGASFGMLQGNNTALIFVSLIVLGVIMMSVKSITRMQALPAAVIVAGILGNLIDRVFRGFVVDFFDLGWFPAFNVADSCLTIGVAWLVIVLIVEEWKEKKSPEPRLNTKASKARRGTKKSLTAGKKKPRDDLF